MGLKATANPITRVISLTDVPIDGVSSIDTQIDLYSDLKEDWLTDPILSRLIFPFTTIGGQDLGSGLFAGAYFFLRNDLGWRIKPYEGDHEAVIDGNLYATDPALTIWRPTDGPYNVQVRLNTSSLTQQVSGVLGAQALDDLRWLRRRLEGDEVRTPTQITVTDKDTSEVLLQKQVTGGQLQSTITITE